MNTLSDHSRLSEPARLSAELGLAILPLCLPRPDLDLYRWPVIACDQFTAEPDYWAKTLEIVGQEPSTLHLILPELYLEHPGSLSVNERISKINIKMQEYLDNGTLCQTQPGWIVLNRSTAEHPSRQGIVLGIDLECYDHQPGNRQLIRATEGTVLDRIPPRLAIRRDAPLELPHVQLLIDDPQHTVIEPLLQSQAAKPPLYQTELMQQGGAIQAWFVDASSKEMLQALKALSMLESREKLGLLCAVGDGNHSLATAKAHWNLLRGKVPADHPARFALVEIINIHDRGLDFHSINRVVFDLSPEMFLDEARKFFQEQEFTVTEDKPGQPTLPFSSAGSQIIPLLWQNRRWILSISKPRHSLAAGSLQDFLDDLVKRLNIRLDYVHGDDVVIRLANQGQLGLLLPALGKSDFFSSIDQNGVLPRKTFSMGEAREKRYYFECRKIR